MLAILMRAPVDRRPAITRRLVLSWWLSLIVLAAGFSERASAHAHAAA
jgi:hypothetical protein